MKNLDINTIESFLFALSIVLVLYPVLGTLLGLIIAIFPYNSLSAPYFLKKRIKNDNLKL